MAETNLPAIRDALEYHKGVIEEHRLKAEAAYWQKAARDTQLLANVSEHVQDPYERYYDDPSFVPAGLDTYDCPTDVEDTHRGDYIPFWRSIEELRIIQGTARYLANYNDIGLGLLEGLADYAIHTGFIYEVESKSEKRPEGKKEIAPKELVSAVQKELNEFNDRTHWICQGESQVFMDSRSWGEQLIEVVNLGQGRAGLDVIPIHQLSEPREEFSGNISDFEGLPPLDWRYGIGTTLDRSQEVIGYFVDPDHTGRNWRVVRAADAVHIKLNTPRCVKRGMTDFFPLFQLLKKLGPLIFNTIVGAAMRASIGYLYTSDSKMGGLTTFGNTTSTTGTGLNGQSESLKLDLHRPGQIKQLQNAKLLAGPMGDAQEAGLIEVIQMGVRIVGARWRMPEYMSSADASNMNRATSETAETPFVRATERKQAVYKCDYSELAWKALAIAAAFGKFREWGIETREELEEFIELKVTTPEVSTHDRLDETQRLSILVDKRVMSKQTWAERADLDWDIEKARIKEEASDPDLQPVGLFGQPPGQEPGKPGQPPQGNGGSPFGTQDDEDDEETVEHHVREDGSLCGANAPGGGGFQPSNTCATGGVRVAKGPKKSGKKSSPGDSPEDVESLVNSWAKQSEDFESTMKEGRAWVNGAKSEKFDRLYRDTQQQLKSSGVKELTAYRGTTIPRDHPLAKALGSGKVKVGDEISVDGLPLTSWSEKQKVGSRFMNGETEVTKGTGIVLESVVPRDNIVGSHRTQKSFLEGEDELIVRNPKSSKLRVRIVESINVPSSMFGEDAGPKDFDLSGTDTQRGIRGDSKAPNDKKIESNVPRGPLMLTEDDRRDIARRILFPEGEYP